MAMMAPQDVLFLNEWNRLVKGFAALDPGGGVGPAGPPRHIDPAKPGQGTITLPGWNTIIKTGPGIQLTKADFKLYHAHLRDPAKFPMDVDLKNHVARVRATSAAAKSSTQPGYSLAIGQVMTAIDNSQDMIATLATLGRLLIWAAPRIGLRAVPVVGHIVLAADILNLFNFVGMVATPLYALLCSGPKEALLAGVPAAVLKNALCKEAWTQAHLNPFSKAARAARQMRALGRLPGVSNVIEALQVTDTLFGYGLSLGALYGTVMEGLFALTNDEPGLNNSLNTKLLTSSFTEPWAKVTQTYPPTALSAALKAARLAQTAPVISGQHDMFSDDLHLEHQAALVGGYQIMAKFFQLGPAAELMRELLPGMWPAPRRRPAWLDDVAPGITDDDAGVGRWWIEGYPRQLEGAHLVPALARPCVAAVSAFLVPRRREPRMTFYGATVNQVTDYAWTMIGGDPDALKWKLQPDYVILTSMVVEGLLVGQATPEARLWRFWLDLRAQVEARDGRMLERVHILDAEARAGITLMRLLPVHATFPAAWVDYFRNPEGFTTRGPNSWPSILDPGSGNGPRIGW